MFTNYNSLFMSKSDSNNDYCDIRTNAAFPSIGYTKVNFSY